MVSENNRVDIEFPFAFLSSHSETELLSFLLKLSSLYHMSKKFTDGGKEGEGWSPGKVRALVL